MKMHQLIKTRIVKTTFFALGILVNALLLGNTLVSAANQCGAPNQNPVTTSIDIGCRAQGNPIIDMLFAGIRFLSMGVGLVVIASIIVAGIQYSTSQGDPQAAAKAKKRVESAMMALILFIFAYAILNYVVPSAVFGI